MTGSTRHPFKDPEVKAVYDGFAMPVRDKLLDLRDLVFETERQTEGAGPIVEALKWGQPSFVTQGRHGSTFRLGPIDEGPATHALYFLCQTTLVATFRQLYADELEFSGNRAILFMPDRPVSRDIVAHCMALAMTYRLKSPNR